MDNPTHPPIGLEGAVERLTEAELRDRFDVVGHAIAAAEVRTINGAPVDSDELHLALATLGGLRTDALASIADREKLEGALRASQGIEPLLMELGDCLDNERPALMRQYKAIVRQVNAALRDAGRLSPADPSPADRAEGV